MARGGRRSQTAPEMVNDMAKTSRQWLVMGLTALALVLVCLPAEMSEARTSSSKLRVKVVRLLEPLQRDVRHLPKRVGPKSRRQSRGQAKVALRAARRGRYCRVVAAIGLIDHAGRASRRLVKVERLLRRAKVAARCRDRGHRGKKIAVHTVDGGGPGSGKLKFQPRANEQGEEEEGSNPLPIGPRRPRKGGRGRPTKVEGTPEPDARTSRRPLPHAFSSKLDDPVSVFRSTSIGAPPEPSLNPLDPTSATAGDVVLVAGNTYLAVSTDAGKTFTYKRPVDIYSTSDPASLKNPDGGAGNDQVLQYDPGTDRFYWLMQYWCSIKTNCQGKNVGENRYRLAVASPKDVAESGATRWRFWDITSQGVGLKGDWLDFPDLAIGRSYLYLTANSFPNGTALWARFRKSALRDGKLDWWYHLYKDQNTLKPVQSVRRTGFAVRRSSTTELDLKRWSESSTNAYEDKIPIGTTPTQDCSATSPDKRDFLAFQGCGGSSSRIGGAAMEGFAPRGNGRIWSAWTSGKREEGTKNKKDNSDNNDGAKTFDQSHIELAILNPDNRTLVEQQTIWNDAYAYSYPYLSGGPSGEIAMTYMAGGAKQYPGWGVGLLTNRRSFVRVANGTVGATRIGDYLAVRPAWPSRTLFAATGNVLNGGFLPYYALFGRKGDRPPRPPVITKPGPIFSLRPDLVVTSLGATSTTVRNAGNGAAGAFFVNVSYVDGNRMPRVDRFVVPSLAAGASTTVNYDCQPGTRTATADTDGQVAESSESNNTATANITCP